MLEESRIIKNEQALSTEYVPEFLPHRENQIQEIARNLNPAVIERKPQNMFIIGPPGIGKTASTKFVFRQFQEYSGIQPIYINTWHYNTSAALLIKIILDFGYFIPRRGLSKDEIVEKLVEILKKTKKGLVVCLDEVDQLVKKDESGLYDLLRLNQYVDNPVGLVMISNYDDVFVNIEPRIKSSLDIEEVKFKPYSLQEMKDILMERCREVFRPGVIEEGVTLLIANHALQKGGDVRVGLECLRKAVRISEQENSDKLKVDHVRKILKQVRAAKIRIIKERLVGAENNIIDLLSKKDRMISTELREEYVKRFREISQTTLRKHIKHLEDIGLLKSEVSRKETRGRKYFIRLLKRKSFK